MRRTWTIIGVGDDVPRSFQWYQSLLGLPVMAAAYDDFGQILGSDGTVLLCPSQFKCRYLHCSYYASLCFCEGSNRCHWQLARRANPQAAS